MNSLLDIPIPCINTIDNYNQIFNDLPIETLNPKESLSARNILLSWYEQDVNSLTTRLLQRSTVLENLVKSTRGLLENNIGVLIRSAPIVSIYYFLILVLF